MSLNLHAVRAIYFFELHRTWRTLFQSIAAPVISTSLYFIVFGSAIGSKMTLIDGVSYGAYIVPGLGDAGDRLFGTGEAQPAGPQSRIQARLRSRRFRLPSPHFGVTFPSPSGGTLDKAGPP